MKSIRLRVQSEVTAAAFMAMLYVLSNVHATQPVAWPSDAAYDDWMPSPADGRRRSPEAVTREIRERLLAGEDLTKETFATIRAHDRLELEVRVVYEAGCTTFTLVDLDKNWAWSGPVRVPQRSEVSKTRSRDVRQAEDALRRGGQHPCSWRARRDSN